LAGQNVTLLGGKHEQWKEEMQSYDKIEDKINIAHPIFMTTPRARRSKFYSNFG
jgi:hypothetical protein